MEWLLALLGLSLVAARVSPRQGYARAALWLAAPFGLLLVLLGPFAWRPDFWRTLSTSNWPPTAFIVGAAVLGIFFLARGWRRR